MKLVLAWLLYFLPTALTAPGRPSETTSGAEFRRIFSGFSIGLGRLNEVYCVSSVWRKVASAPKEELFFQCPPSSRRLSGPQAIHVIRIGTAIELILPTPAGLNGRSELFLSPEFYRASFYRKYPTARTED